MIEEGEECLTCMHYARQLWSFEACVQHFTIHRYFHRHDIPSLSDLADAIRVGQNDAMRGTSVVLESFYG